MSIGNITGAIVFLCVASALISLGVFVLVDYFFFDDAIRVSEPIIPEIELIITDNKVDTLYIYKK